MMKSDRYWAFRNRSRHWLRLRFQEVGSYSLRLMEYTSLSSFADVPFADTG